MYPTGVAHMDLAINRLLPLAHQVAVIDVQMREMPKLIGDVWAHFQKQ